MLNAIEARFPAISARILPLLPPRPGRLDCPSLPAAVLGVLGTACLALLPASGHAQANTPYEIEGLSNGDVEGATASNQETFYGHYWTVEVLWNAGFELPGRRLTFFRKQGLTFLPTDTPSHKYVAVDVPSGHVGAGQPFYAGFAVGAGSKFQTLFGSDPIPPFAVELGNVFGTGVDFDDISCRPWIRGAVGTADELLLRDAIRARLAALSAQVGATQLAGYPFAIYNQYLDYTLDPAPLPSGVQPNSFELFLHSQFSREVWEDVNRTYEQGLHHVESNSGFLHAKFVPASSAPNDWSQGGQWEDPDTASVPDVVSASSNIGTLVDNYYATNDPMNLDRCVPYAEAIRNYGVIGRLTGISENSSYYVDDLLVGGGYDLHTGLLTQGGYDAFITAIRGYLAPPSALLRFVFAARQVNEALALPVDRYSPLLLGQLLPDQPADDAPPPIDQRDRAAPERALQVRGGHLGRARALGPGRLLPGVSCRSVRGSLQSPATPSASCPEFCPERDTPAAVSG